MITNVILFEKLNSLNSNLWIFNLTILSPVAELNIMDILIQSAIDLLHIV